MPAFPVSAAATRRTRRSGRRWSAIGMAFCAIAGPGVAGAQGLWDDAAFARYRQAVEAMNRKDYEAAERLGGEAIREYPDHVLAHFLRGQAALAQSRWEPAAQAFARVTELYPASAAGHQGLGMASEELGRIDDAEREYDRALALNPDDQALRARLAFLLERAGRDRPQAVFQDLAARGTQIPEVWIALGRAAYAKGDLAAAETAFTRAAALRDDGATWFNLGVVQLQLDKRADAQRAFERAAAHAGTRDQAAAELERLRTR